MRFQLLAKDIQSGEKNCPSVSDDLDGDEFILVGPTVDPSLVENVLPGEGAVRIKREIVIEAAQKYLAAR
ncbi:MAG: hypothetical protein ACRDQ4_26560 [Pseudonocardiaceae bacterium]